MGAAQSNVKMKPIENKKPTQDTNTQYFEPTYKLAWLIGIENYENVKSSITGKPLYANVTQAKKDIEVMRELFFTLKFDEIMTTINASSTKEMTDGTSKIYNKAKDGKLRLLLFVYYSGHGIM